MLSGALRRRVLLSIKNQTASRTAFQRRWATQAPKPGSGPLLERRADRELPDVDAWTFKWRRTLPLFVLIMAASSFAIFNYHKMSSPVTASILYSLRTSRRAREYLGDEIYFRYRIPIIWGEMNQLHGRIDISFAVRGSRNTAIMRFASFRPTSKGIFETTEWSLETASGEKIDLLDGVDPIRIMELDDEPIPLANEKETTSSTRGFRQGTFR